MELHVISVGGSLIVPDEIDTSFLKSFKGFLENRIEKHEDRFILIAGGGKIARRYQDALSGVYESAKRYEKNMLGIYATRLNGELLKDIFGKYAHSNLVIDLEKEKIDFNEKVLVGAGCRPGASTDYKAVLLAEKFGAKSVVNLSNIEYVYSEDPKKNPNAIKYGSLRWRDFIENIVGTDWNSGMSVPFDPIASKKAQELGLSVAIMVGNLSNLGKYLNGEKFKGTVIK